MFDREAQESYTGGMEVRLSEELEAKLNRAAAGRN
jgi:predicted HicB family RNase H-like nuclease